MGNLATLYLSLSLHLSLSLGLGLGLKISNLGLPCSPAPSLRCSVRKLRRLVNLEGIWEW